MNRLKHFLMNWAKGMGIALVASILLGAVIAMVTKWPIIQGIYVVCIVFSIFAMIYASLMFVGTPQMRYEYLVKGKMLRRQGKSKEVEGMEDHGVLPALIAVGLVLIGFALEASMH